MKRLWRFLAVWLMISQCFLTTAYAKPDWPSDTSVQAQAGIVIDADTGTVIYGSNIRTPYPPASITKLLTALIVIENASLDSMVTFSSDAINNVEAGSGNNLGLSTGDEMTVRDCLYGLLLKSSNQCANALAEHVAGSRSAFVTMMNEKIQALGCQNSQFANPSGLNSSDQYVTAYDMALIARAAFNNPTLLTIDSAKSYTLPSTASHPNGMKITMSHRILVTSDTGSEYYCKGAIGGKTGYTSLAGHTLVTYAERDGRRLISVILKGTRPQYYIDGKALLEFGFSRFQNLTIADHETSYTTGDQPVAIGDKSYAPADLVLEPSYGTKKITIPKEASFEDVEKSLSADMPYGQPGRAIAMIQYTYNERKIGRAYLQLSNQAQAAADASLAAESEEASRQAQEERQSEQTPSAEAQTSISGPDASADSPSDSPPVSRSGKPGNAQRQNGFLNLSSALSPLIVGLATTLFLLLCSLAYLTYRKRREEKERMLRRQRRLERLRESNISEEEFLHMLEQRQMERRGKHK